VLNLGTGKFRMISVNHVTIKEIAITFQKNDILQKLLKKVVDYFFAS